MKHHKGNQKKKETLVLALLILIALTAVFATFLIVYAIDQQTDITSDAVSPYTVPLEVLTQAANSEDGSRRAYVKISVVLELENRGDLREINRYADRSRAVITQTINATPAESLIDPNQLEKIQSDMISNFKKELSVKPKNIFYDQLIVQ
ncbi:MAG: hypothetical protein D5S00_04950 [Tindallia sp. MSAO_Bac2]|nr:MAG: hypothetical protein D5S00_04950 [Tindallia sp. MSAO_Bac2]